MEIIEKIKTNKSDDNLTEIQKISSIPSFLKSLNLSSNAGSCCEEHVGVNAPGSENINTRLSAKRSVDEIVIQALSPSR